jgi:hypothetical protein
MSLTRNFRRFHLSRHEPTLVEAAGLDDHTTRKPFQTYSKKYRQDRHIGAY